MIKNLIFDFGKVLVDYDFINVMSGWFTDEERKQRFFDCIMNPYWGERMDREDVPFEEVIREMQDAYPEFAEELYLFDVQYLDFVTGEVPGMKALLSNLKKQGFRLYGLTNWCSRVHSTMRQFDIFELLDGQIISSEEHLIKPDKAVYQRLFDRFGLDPAECVFTDDKPENVEGSIRAGMDAILFVNAEQYAQELAKRIPGLILES